MMYGSGDVVRQIQLCYSLQQQWSRGGDGTEPCNQKQKLVQKPSCGM